VSPKRFSHSSNLKEKLKKGVHNFEKEKKGGQKRRWAWKEGNRDLGGNGLMRGGGVAVIRKIKKIKPSTGV